MSRAAIFFFPLAVESKSGSRLFNQHGVISTHTDLMELDPSANSRLSFCKRKSRVTSWLPPTIISPHMITLRVVVCKPCNSNCWGDFSAFPWWVALISAGWVHSWGTLWNIHGIYYKYMDVKQQKMKIKNMRVCVCVYKVQTVENYKTTFKCRRFLIPPSLFGIKWKKTLEHQRVSVSSLCWGKPPCWRCEGVKCCFTMQNIRLPLTRTHPHINIRCKHTHVHHTY